MRWRIRANANDASSGVRLRVLDGRFATTSTGATEFVTGSGDRIYEFDTRQPIKAGDYVALEFTASPALYANSFKTTPGNDSCSWGSLPEGTAPQTYICGEDGGEYLYNAEIEPDRDCDGMGDESQDQAVGGGCLPRKLAALVLRKQVRSKGGAVWLTISCAPIGGNCGDAIALFARGRSGALLRGHRRIALTPFFVPAGSTERLRVQLTRPALRVLRRTEAIKARLELRQANQTLTAPLTIRRSR